MDFYVRSYIQVLLHNKITFATVVGNADDITFTFLFGDLSL